jgi:glucosamine kinase
MFQSNRFRFCMWPCLVKLHGMDLFIGIDGGGTSCRARIRTSAGDQLAESKGGPSNIYQDFDRAIATIVNTAQEAAQGANVRLQDLHAGLGLAGIVTSVGSEKVLAQHLPFKSVVVNNDAYVACIGAFAGEDGGIVITGTGSIGFALVGGRQIMLGGWGFQLGDHGSGAWLGHHAVRRAALAMDGLIQPTSLIEEVHERLGRTRPELSRWSETARPSDYAELAPLVFLAASKGDVVGMSIIIEGAAAISMLGRGLLARGCGRISLQGGLSRLYPPYLDADVKAAQVEPQADALDGAILMAKRSLQQSGLRA